MNHTPAFAFPAEAGTRGIFKDWKGQHVDISGWSSPSKVEQSSGKWLSKKDRSILYCTTFDGDRQ